MVNPTGTTRHRPAPHSNTHAIALRRARLADLALCPECEPAVTQMADDSADLIIEVAWLSGAVIVVRRESANRLAAIRTPLRAAAEGEADPLGLLRDELAESPDAQIPGQGRGCCR